MKKTNKNRGITLVALIITIIILLVLAGIAIATLGEENGLFAKTKQAKKKHTQAEMQEQLTLALNDLQIEKKGNASLDDVTQEWINSVILSDYNPAIKEDASIGGKMVTMVKNGVKGIFLLGQNLEISKIEYDVSTLEFDYETVKLENGKVKILIKITDKVNGIKQIDYPDPSESALIMDNRKEPVGIDYIVELGKEYKFVITTGDGNKTEKIIKIDDYFYNVTKTLGTGATINNTVTKVAYNKTYETSISTEGNYAITDLTVTMGGQQVTTLGNNVVDINTGKIKIEKVTGDINITVTTKKLEIQYTTIAVHTSSSASNGTSLEANTQTRGTTLYINIIAKLEGNNCTVVLKSDNSKSVPYAVTANGKYTFIVSGTYNGKTISEEKEVMVNQYMSAKGVVKYDAGDWTKSEIEELQKQNLYNINKEKVANNTSGLDFIFGGFTYKGDTTNASDIASGNIITSRNQSVKPQDGYGTPQYEGWQILELKDSNGNIINKEKEIGDKLDSLGTGEKIYVNKITHAGSPENFVYYYAGTLNDVLNAEYILSGGTRQTTYNARDWSIYKDKELDKNGYISNVHVMDYNEALLITGITNNASSIRNTGAYYWLGNAADWYEMYLVNGSGGIGWTSMGCYGIRPVVEMNDGVYIKSGSGTEGDPYILGKD